MACGARCAQDMDKGQSIRPKLPAADGAAGRREIPPAATGGTPDAAGARRRAEDDSKDFKRVMVLRNQEEAQRAAYYARLEAYLAQHFAGKLDLPALIKREAQVTELEARLQDRQIELEKEYAARRERLDAELRQAKLATAQAAEEQTARAQASVLESRKNLERSFVVKLAELTDQEVRLKVEAEALAQRQTQFEAFCGEQRARLDLDCKAAHNSIADQMQDHIEDTERFLADRHDAAASWERQRAALLKEINDLRHQREIDLSRLLDLERRAAQADEDCTRFSVMLLQEKTRARELQEEWARRDARKAGDPE